MRVFQKKFLGFKGPLGFNQIVKEGYITLEKAEEKQKEFKSKINKMVKGSKNSENQKNAKKILKNFANHEKKLSICLMIILEFYLKLNTKQNMEKISKY